MQDSIDIAQNLSALLSRLDTAPTMLFREGQCDPDQLTFLPPTLDEVVPAGARVRILSNVIDEMNCDILFAAYPGGGAPAYSPVMMLKILLFAYSEGVRSSRRIAERCIRDTHYMWLAHMSRPDFHTICRFRRRHEKAIRELFSETVQLCQREGLVLLEDVAVDGSKIYADVSCKETYSKKRVEEAVAYTQLCIDAILQEAEAQDAAEEKSKGDDNPPPTETGGSNFRLPLVKKLERRKQRAEAAKANMAESGENTACATDLDARVMNVQGLNKPAYNTQAAVDRANLVIVGAFVSQKVNDYDHMEPVIESIIESTGCMPDRASADKGYLSVTTLSYLEDKGIDAYIAGRQDQLAKAEFVYDAENDTIRIPATATTEEQVLRYRRKRTLRGEQFRIYCSAITGKEAWLTHDVARELRLRKKMKCKLETVEGKAIYSLRQQIVEPVFGHIKGSINLRRFLLRGLSGATIEFMLACSVHNMAKLIKARTPAAQPHKRRRKQKHEFCRHLWRILPSYRRAITRSWSTLGRILAVN